MRGIVSGVVVAQHGTIIVGVGNDIVTVDVREPRAPQTIGTLYSPGASVLHSLDLSPDSTTLLAVGYGAVHHIDARNPSALTLAGTLEIPGARSAVFSGEGHAVVSGRASLFSLDLSNPGTTPVRDTSGDAAEHCWQGADVQLSRDGSRAFVAAQSLLVLDITDTAFPSLVGRHNAQMNNLALAADGQTLFGAGRGGLWAFDLAEDSLSALGVFDEPSAEPMDVVPSANGNTAFLVTEGGGGLDIVDTSDLTAPTRVSHFYIRHTDSIVLSPDETTVYVADPYENGLLVLDVTDPAMPMVRGSLPVVVTELALCEGGETLLAANGDNLLVIDVRGESLEVLAEHYIGSITDISVSADCRTAYVTDFESLQIVDITGAPEIVGAFEVPGTPTALALTPDEQTVAVVSDDTRSCLGLADITPPTLEPLGRTRGGVLRYQLRWPDQYPADPERFAWHASAGHAAISDVDFASRTAIVAWTVAESESAPILRVAVGNHHYYQVATAIP